jgi:hypothetical protein
MFPGRLLAIVELIAQHDAFGEPCSLFHGGLSLFGWVEHRLNTFAALKAIGNR